MKKMILLSAITVFGCFAGLCCMQEKEVEFKQLPYKKNTGIPATPREDLSLDMSKVGMFDYLDEEFDCPVPTTPPVRN